jgi:glycolate oxidase
MGRCIAASSKNTNGHEYTNSQDAPDTLYCGGGDAAMSNAPYRKVDEGIIRSLKAIVGENRVVVDAEDLERYAHDEVVGLRADPEVAVQVANQQQVSEIFRLAQQMRIPVTPRGAGWGLSGGAVPLLGGIVLSLEKMDRILEIDKENLMITVEPGVITGNIHRAVEAEGLFYPPDPASLDSCSIGGNIAEGAGGPRAVKYGTTKDYVCGLEAVLPSGEVIRMGGKLVKNVTGYNLIQLLVGSEGTLAVVTKIILRLLPLPKVQVDLLVPYEDIQGAADTVSDIISRRILPTAIEFMERDSMLAVERLIGREVPYRDAAALLLIQLDGNLQEAVEADYEVVSELCLKHGAGDGLVAQDRPTRDRLWEARRKIIEALKHESPINHMEDVVVPRARIPALLKGMSDFAQRYSVRIISFGHAGDGNVHVNILKDDMPEDRWKELIPPLQAEIYRLALSLGGTLTGEHGVGATRREFLPLAIDEPQIEIMRRIRDIFDPNQILNPGKIFPFKRRAC